MAYQHLGKDVTPNTGTHGWYTLTGRQVAILQTVPSPGAILHSVFFWAATTSPNSDYLWGVIWDSSGNVLAHGSGVLTSGGQSSNVGATQWYEDILTDDYFVTAGTQIYIGWQPNSSTHSTSWAYNGNDHSPNAHFHSASGFPSSFAGNTEMNVSGGSKGAVATYATYTPAGGYVSRSGLWVAGEADVDRSSTPTAAPTFVSRSSVWQPGS
jgi:hypothetical protein